MVHGTPWSSWTWRRVAPRLAERFTVYVFDLLGFGASDQRPGQDVSARTRSGRTPSLSARAHAILDAQSDHFDGFGQAKRAPGDPNIPVIGEEFAAARALSEFSHKLLEAAAARIDQFRD
jgi:hypothetical protein